MRVHIYFTKIFLMSWPKQFKHTGLAIFLTVTKYLMEIRKKGFLSFFFKGFPMIGNFRESSPLQRGRHDTLTLREVQAGACQVPVDGEAECRES